MVFNQYKMVVQFSWTASSILNSDGLNVFLQNYQTPGPDFRKVGKSLSSDLDAMYLKYYSVPYKSN